MGYPMTYQRVISRSGLAPNSQPSVAYNLAEVDRNVLAKLPDDAARISLLTFRVDDLAKLATNAQRHHANLKDDLRRLERDATDEGSIIRQLHDRTGIPRDHIAGVLKEFLAL